MKSHLTRVVRPLTAPGRRTTLGLLLALLSAAGAPACTKTSFKGGGNATGRPGPGGTPVAQGSPARSPDEEGRNRNQKLCADSHKATRLAIIVDNSLSHGLTSGEVQVPQNGVYRGTDPVRMAPSARGQTEKYTDRQNALYDLVVRSHELDAQARAKNPQFLGTDIAISSFPDGSTYAGMERSVAVTAAGLFQGSRLTPLKTMTLDANGRENLWNGLQFTHRPEGTTPYTTALSAARDLLKRNRATDDPRPDVVLFLSDGLPTDEMPSGVLKTRAELPNTELYLFSLYAAGSNQELQNTDAYRELKKSFLDDRPEYRWARKPGRTDGYQGTDAEFERYWKDLLAIPQRIANRIVNVNGATNLKGELDKILQLVQSCP